MKLDRKEVGVLMRAMLRSLEHTPEAERKAHEEVYKKLTTHYVHCLPKQLVKDVGAAVDHLIGR